MTRLGSAPMQLRFKTLMLTLLATASTTLSAAPVGYSINSDSGSSDYDSLYEVDLGTGVVSAPIGKVQLGPLESGIRKDVEGLAFAPSGDLYGLDDESLKLFRINTANAQVDPSQDFDLRGGDLTVKDNDFGMTFACDRSLYISSVIKEALYRIDIDSDDTTPQLVGAFDLSGVKISALAAEGSPARLYGLSNGTLGEGGGAPPGLYEINTASGKATLIGLLGNGVAPYAEGGLAFDDAGQLWAITDRSLDLKPSQVMRINKGTGAASDILEISVAGFESLAITTPGDCDPIPPVEPPVDEPVILNVAVEWFVDHEDLVADESAEIGLVCQSVEGGDGSVREFDRMFWRFSYVGASSSQAATVYPRLDGSTHCWTVDLLGLSSVESESTCSARAPVSLTAGDTEETCTVSITYFYEGIPSLNQYGLALISALMLLTGLIAVRRTG